MADDRPDVHYSDGKWKASLTKPDGSKMDVGTFEDREQARAAYFEARGKLYPAPPPPGPTAGGHDLMAESIGTASPTITHGVEAPAKAAPEKPAAPVKGSKK